MTSPTPTLSSPINPFLLNRSIRQLSDTNGGGGRIRNGSIVTSVVTPTLSRLRKRRRLEVPVGAPLVLPLPNLPPAAAMPCKRYHQETSLVLDYDRSNLDRKHVIIPFDQLISFLDLTLFAKNAENLSQLTNGSVLELQPAPTGFAVAWRVDPSRLVCVTQAMTMLQKIGKIQHLLG